MRLMDCLPYSGTALPGVRVLSGASAKCKQGSPLPEDGSRERSKRSSRCFHTSISNLVTLTWPEIKPAVFLLSSIYRSNLLLLLVSSNHVTLLVFSNADDQHHSSSCTVEDASWTCFVIAGLLQDGTALLFLGQCFESGFGVQRHVGKAFEYYKQAAQAGNQQAKSLLTPQSDLHSKGEGTFVWTLSFFF